MGPLPYDETRIDALPTAVKAIAITVSQQGTVVGEIVGADLDDLDANIQALTGQANLIRQRDPNYLLFIGPTETC